jgi:hypothetical protein
MRTIMNSSNSIIPIKDFPANIRVRTSAIIGTGIMPQVITLTTLILLQSGSNLFSANAANGSAHVW